MAMVSAFAGCMPRTIHAERGVLTWAQIREKLAPAHLYYRAQTGLIEIENTHNMAGGTVTPLEVLHEIWAGARDAGLPVHLDGARVFNAAAALGVGVRELTEGFDTVMFCLSKGLCAPVGSMLVGSRETIGRARRYRKALGGGMRQAGILAAAGLIALEEMPQRLAEDHANARLLAEAVAEMKQVEMDLSAVQTNIVLFGLRNGIAAGNVVDRLQKRGVRASAVGPQAIRLVTHHDVDRAACVQAATALQEEIARTPA
jgi:threonine aldolase